MCKTAVVMCIVLQPFSQSLSTLTVIEDFLAKRPVPVHGDMPSQPWVRNINYYSESSVLCPILTETTSHVVDDQLS